MQQVLLQNLWYSRKIWIALLISAPLHSFTHAQLHLEWEHTFSSPINFFDSKSAIDLQGNLYLAACDFGDSSDVHVYKISSSGTLQWHFRYQGDSLLSETLEDLYISPDGHVVISGCTYQRLVIDIDVVLEQSSKAYILKLDPNGDINWVRKFSAQDSTLASGIRIAKKDSIYYLLLEEFNSIYSERNFSLIKYSDEGDLLGDQVIYTSRVDQEVSLGNYLVNNRMIFLPLLATGRNQETLRMKSFNLQGELVNDFIIQSPHYFDFYADIGKSNFYGAHNLGIYGITKLDSSGRHVWDYAIPKNLPPNSFGDKVNQMKIQEDCIYITGKHFGVNTNGDLLTVKLDLDGNIIWENRFENQRKHTYEGGEDLIQLNNQVVIAGTHQLDSAGQNNFLLLILDREDGKILHWESSDYGTDRDDYLYKLNPLNDHDFYLIGYSKNWDNGLLDVIVRKYGLPTRTNALNPGSTIKVFPIPTENLITVVTNGARCTFELYNCSGHLLMSGDMHKEGMQLSLEEFTPGLYYLKTIFEDHFEVQKVLKTP